MFRLSVGDQISPDSRKFLFAQNLKAERMRAGLTQTELAERAGLSVAAVRAWERASREPGIGNVCAVAAVLGVHPYRLFCTHAEWIQSFVV